MVILITEELRAGLRLDCGGGGGGVDQVKEAGG